jgi:hypothetical protein
MNRLTEYCNGEAIRIRNGIIQNKDCLRKLAAYEDIGFEPEEVIKMFYEKLKFRELLKQMVTDLPKFCESCANVEKMNCFPCTACYNGNQFKYIHADEINEVLKNE